VDNFGQEVVTYYDDKPYLNLHLALTRQLSEAGVLEENIFDSEVCTIHNSDKYCSFRAEKKKDGNFALIGYKDK
jgi:copper oxidase (laccase) domain-containing protein